MTFDAGMIATGKRAVADLKEADEKSSAAQWVLGDLAREICPALPPGPRPPGSPEAEMVQDLKAFAEEIGIEYSTLRSLKSTAIAWEEIVGRPTIFSTAKALNKQEDRYDLVSENPDMTQKEAREIVRARRPQKETPSGDVEVVQEGNFRPGELVDAWNKMSSASERTLMATLITHADRDFITRLLNAALDAQKKLGY